MKAAPAGHEPGPPLTVAQQQQLADIERHLGRSRPPMSHWLRRNAAYLLSALSFVGLAWGAVHVAHVGHVTGYRRTNA